MNPGLLKKICNFLQHPLRKIVSENESVCLLCGVCCGRYVPNPKFIDRIYIKLLKNYEKTSN